MTSKNRRQPKLGKPHRFGGEWTTAKLDALANRLRDQCRAASLPYFFKQWGGKNKKMTGRLLEGRTWDEMPAV